MIFRFFATILVIFGLALTFFYLVQQIPQTTSVNQNIKHKTVTVYTALDRIFSEPLLKEFEQLTGIKVNASYDIELNKTVGLVNKIISERDRPQCDVFWNNEIIRTLILKRKGLLQPYQPTNAKGLPQQFRSDYWTGFAARARIFIVNTQQLNESQYPLSSYDFTQKIWTNKFGIAKPLFGTTSTHVAALFSLDREKAKQLFLNYKNNDCQILAGNSMVKDAVVEGNILAGWTDTDDASLAIVREKPVKIIVPDQTNDRSFPGGAILIPNTVSLIKNCPHPNEGKALIEFLLRPQTEQYLAQCESAQIPLHKNVAVSENVLKINDLKLAPIDWQRAADELERANKFVQDLFLK